MGYEDLLERAYEGLPEILKEESRFQVPVVDSNIQGRVTVILNFADVAKALNRSMDLLSKYFVREMGTSGELEGQRLVLKGQFRDTQLQERLESFIQHFIICPECKRPDTKMIQEKRVSFLKCEACGARHPVATIKQEVTPKEQKKDIAIGDEITVQITKTGRKGDGMAQHGGYLVFVTNSREGQTLKIKIKNINKKMAFADIVQVI